MANEDLNEEQNRLFASWLSQDVHFDEEGFGKDIVVGDKYMFQFRIGGEGRC